MKKLDEISKVNPFKVPEGYFEDLNKKIVLITSSKRKRPVLVRLRPYLLAAASVTLFILLGYTVTRLLIPREKQKQEQETLLIDYLSPYINEYDIYSFEVEVNPVPDNEDTTVTGKSDIIEYLIINDVRTDDIYEFL